MRIRPFLLAAGLLTGGCGHDGEAAPSADAGAEPTCRVVAHDLPLLPEIRETSGVVASRTTPGVLWTHNDSGGEPVLFALDSAGGVLGSVEIRGARNVDWEDVAAGPCPGGGECLFIADTGDNEADRSEVSIYRVPEPGPADAVSATAVRTVLRYPEGPRDAESLFVLPTGESYLVTKGRDEAAELYAAGVLPSAGGTVTLRRLRILDDAPEERMNQVTGASADPSGRWVAIRTYTAVYLFRTEQLLRGGAEAVRFDLLPLGEPQGEGVALRSDGTIFLTSEGASKGEAGRLARIECELP